jgi:hypothetical protein
MMIMLLRSGQLNRRMQPLEFETAIIPFELDIQGMVMLQLQELQVRNYTLYPEIQYRSNLQ